MKTSLILLACFSAFALPCNAKTKIACVGDSITFGYTIPHRETANYPYYLQQLLGDEYEVMNFGNSGKTAGSFPGQTGRWYGSTKEHQNAMAFKGDIYICNLGINDTGAWWDPKLFVQGYNDLIDQWRAASDKATVYMWTKLAPDFRGPVGTKAYPGNVFTPEYSFPTRDNGSAANRPEAERLLAQVAAKHKAIALDAYSTIANHPEWYGRDGLHPNAEGARAIARFTCSALYRDHPWKQTTPRIEVNRKEHTITLTNNGKQALVLDSGALATTGEKKTCVFRFGAGSVLGPDESATIRFQADKNSNDFAAMSTKASCSGNVRFIPAPAKASQRKKWDAEAAQWGARS